MKGTKLLKQIYIASAVLFCVGITGCRDKMSDIYKGGKEEPEKVPNDFGYPTRKNVEVNLQYDVPTGYNVRFEMFTENPLSLNEAKDYVKDTTLISFLEGYTDDNGNIKISVDIPAYAKDIYAYSPSLSVPVLLHASVNGNVVSEFKSVKVESRSVSASRGVTKGTYYDSWPTYSVGLVKNNVNDISRKEITSNEKKIIDASLPMGSSPDIKLNSTYHRGHFTLQEDATIELYFVSHNGSERINSLAYFTYTGDNIPAQKEINSKLNLAYSTTYNIEEGTGVQLKNEKGSTTFAKGTTLGFALLVNANGAQNNKNVNVVYSEFADGGSKYNFNSYRITKPQIVETANRAHMVAFKLGEDNDGNVLIGLGFEDQPWDASPNTYNRGDFRDDIFIMKVTPKSAIPDIPDGVDPEEEPEYVNSRNYNGILSFEDCWPSAGDFDLNDLVIKYKRALNFRNDGYVVSIDETYTYLHDGADYTNGFAYEMGGGVKKENIKSINITTNNSYNYDGWGLDEDFEKATVTLFDNSKRCPVGTEFTVHIILKNAVDLLDFGTLGTPYNPFIVVKGRNGSDDFFKQNRTEVHLPKFAPTSKHNSVLFGTEDDASDVSKNIYYVRNNESRYPFAIDLAGATGFNSSEHKAIDVTYPDFIKWVESNGKECADWYLHPSKQ